MIHTITLTEQEAKHATLLVNIKRAGIDQEATIFTVTFKEEDQGSLYLEVYEDSNPTECIANNYPEFFTMYGGN